MDKGRYEELVAELKEGKSNCIIIKGEDAYRFCLPGVRALMTLLKENPGLLKGSVIFDKVVGKGAAALIILGEVKEIYADIISEHAVALLTTTDIKFRYEEKVPFIENKTKDGVCPIEMLSISCSDPKDIHEKISMFFSII
ncbi:MAG: DUF1893 domain-containing protein [Muribaculaceae bacterium]|nr:DUF1893 domain-containing protein [Muribaculaceae bacterium]